MGTRRKLCLIRAFRDFLGSPVVKTPCFHCRGHGFDSIPGQGTKIPQAMQRGQKKKKKSFYGVSIQLPCHMSQTAGSGIFGKQKNEKQKCKEKNMCEH